MKSLIPINNNIVYSEILFKINDNKVYSLEFANKFNKKQQTVQKQLEFLKKKGYLNKEKGKNKQLYFINWGKIEEEFYNLTKESFKDKKSLDKYRKGVKEIFKEDIFMDLLKSSFKVFQNSNITLKRLFPSFVISFVKTHKDNKLNFIKSHKFLMAMSFINLGLYLGSPEFYIDRKLKQYNEEYQEKQIKKKK